MGLILPLGGRRLHGRRGHQIQLGPVASEHVQRITFHRFLTERLGRRGREGGEVGAPLTLFLLAVEMVMVVAVAPAETETGFPCLP
jgi:hypothetical protein